MFYTITRIARWVSVPVLLIASIFSRYAAGYELPVDLAICLGAMVLALHAVRRKEFFWAAGFFIIVVVFSPLSLVVKIFLLMGVTCVAILVSLLAAFRSQPLLTLPRSNRKVSPLPMLALLAAVPVAGMAPTADALDWQGKLHDRAGKTYGPLAIVGLAACAGVLQTATAPEEWGQGGRYGLSLAWHRSGSRG